MLYTLFLFRFKHYLSLGAIVLLVGSALFVPGASQGDQYNVGADVLNTADKAMAQAVQIRDYALLALTSLSVQDALKNIQQVLNLVDGLGATTGILELTRELLKAALDKRWTEVSFTLNNVVSFYDVSGRKNAQAALEIARRSTPSAPVPSEMKNEIRELFAFVTAALGAGEDPLTPVTAGGLRTVRDFLKRQKS